MPTLDGLGAELEQEEKNQERIGEFGTEGQKSLEDQIPAMEPPGFNWRAVIFAKTGPGSIDDYVQHPLNWKESRGLAQVIRGLTGMFDSLRYAIIDIVIGGYHFAEENKPAPDQPAPRA